MTQAEQIELLVRIDQTVTNLNHQLFGNGQPGIIAQHAEEIKELRDYKSKATGVIAVISALFAMLGTALITHIFRKG